MSFAPLLTKAVGAVVAFGSDAVLDTPILSQQDWVSASGEN